MLQASYRFQVDQGEPDAPVVPHGAGSDPSLVAIAKALDAARLQGGHGEGDAHDHPHDHDHDHDHAHDVDLDWGEEPKGLEHPDERTDEHSHNWGAGRSWTPGGPVPAPIVSSLPVRSRSRGRWDGDGM